MPVLPDIAGNSSWTKNRLAAQTVGTIWGLFQQIPSTWRCWWWTVFLKSGIPLEVHWVGLQFGILKLLDIRFQTIISYLIPTFLFRENWRLGHAQSRLMKMTKNYAFSAVLCRRILLSNFPHSPSAQLMHELEADFFLIERKIRWFSFVAAEAKRLAAPEVSLGACYWICPSTEFEILQLRTDDILINYIIFLRRISIQTP